jgi:hypothetical protein
MNCPQCSRATSVWRRGLLTRLCPTCRAKPGSEALAAVARWRRAATIAVLLTVAATLSVGLAAILYCTPVIRGPVEDTPFSSEEWVRGDARSRGRMVHNLLASRVLMGKSREEVARLLGPPDDEGAFGLSFRYRVDVGYRWVIRPYLHDLVIRFYKQGHWAYVVAVEPTEGA